MLIIPDCLTCMLFPFLLSLPSVTRKEEFLSPILPLQTSGQSLSPFLPAYLHFLCGSHSFSHCHVPTEPWILKQSWGYESMPGLSITIYPEGTCCCCCLVAQLYPTLCNPVAHSPSGSSAHGTPSKNILEWDCHFSSRGSS